MKGLFVWIALFASISCQTGPRTAGPGPYRSGPLPDLSGNPAPSEDRAHLDKLTFTGTSTYSSLIRKIIAHPPVVQFLPPDFDSKIQLAPPPANSSERTQAELRHLIDLKTFRTAETLEKILQEREKGHQKFHRLHGHDLGLFQPVDALSEYLTYGLMDTQALILYYKKKYDRVRPDKLMPEISPVIPVPLHSSYPSGHATESYLIGLLLSRLDPAHRDDYLRDALAIGIRREIAGLHYPSDTAAGIDLATAIDRLLHENRSFMELHHKARKEWDARSH